MSTPRQPDPAKLFFAVLSSQDAPIEELRHRLSLEFSAIQHELEPYAMTDSDYYVPEMGAHLQKTIWVCAQSIDPAELVDIKLHTNRLEAHYAGKRGRRVNIDPGYLDLARVVLATGKNNAHRLYIASGIYEEITLLWKRREGYQPLPWTYPDYRRAEVLNFLNLARESFHEELRQLPCTST